MLFSEAQALRKAAPCCRRVRCFHFEGVITPFRWKHLDIRPLSRGGRGGHAEEAAALYEACAAAGGDRADEALAFAEALRSQGAAF